MAIRVIYDQTLPATGNGDSAGWIKVLDVTQLVAGCTGFIYDHDTGPIGVRVEAIDSPNSKIQLSILQPSGSYLVSTLVAYTVAGGTSIKIPQQAREDSGYVPPAGGAIAGLVAGGSTAGSGFVTFADSNGVTFGMSNNVVTASVQAQTGGGGNLALSAGNYSTNSGTVLFRNSNGMSFGMDTNGEITGSYTVPDISQIAFSNSNNVSFGVNGWTVTATASFTQTVQTQGLVNIQGSTGTIQFSNANGVSFGGNNNTITASVVIPPQTVQTQNMVSIKGSTGNIFFDNANGLTFGGNNSTITASYTVPTIPPQTVQPVAASASNGSFQFSTLGFNQGGGVTFSTNVNGINAIVKTDYQSSNANYLTSQSNQAVSGTNGSFTFQTLSLGASNGVSFYTTNGSVVASYTVPNVPAQTVQPVAASGSNGSFLFSTLSHGNSNGISFYTTNGSIVASYTVPNVPAQTVQPVAASGSNGSFLFSTLSHGNSNGLSFYTTNGSIVGSYTVPAIPGATVFSNSNNVSFGLNGSTITATATFAGGGAALSAGANSQNTGTVIFSNSNSVSFGLNAGTLTASFSTQPQTNQTVGVYGVGNTTGQSSSSTIDARSLSFQGAGVASVGMSNGSVIVSVANAGGADGFNRIAAGTQTAGTLQTVVFSNSNNVSFGLSNSSVLTASASFAQSTQPVAASASNGSFAFSTLGFVQGSGVTWATQAGGIQASVRTDYQSSNANYLTSQSNQAFSASGGSSAFQTLNFANSNNVTFSNSNGSVVASASFPAQTVQPVAASGSNGSFLFSTLSHGNSNGATFYTTNGSIVLSYTVPTIPGATVFSNSNNVSFGLNGSTVTATATFPAQTVQPVAVSGSNGSFAFSTLTMGASNGLSFYTTNGSVVGSYTVPTQTVQPVAASASNGSFNFSTLRFVEGSGVTWATQAGGIQASVKTDYQSSNANYLTSQSNQAFSASGGSSAFQTLNFANSNGITFSNSNGSVIASYTVPAIPGATVFSNSNNVSFGLNGSTVTATATFPAQTVQPVAASASNGSFNFSTLRFSEGGGVTWSTNANGINAVVKTDYQSSNANYLTSQSTGPAAIAVPGTTVSSGTIIFSNSNGVSFGYGTGTATNIITVTVQPGAAAGIAAFSAGTEQATSGTVQFINSNGVSFGMGSGASANQITASISPAAATGIGAIAGGTQTATSGTVVFSNSNNVSFTMNGSSQLVASASFAQSTQPVAVSGSNGSFAFSTLTMGNSNGLTFYTTNGSLVGSYTVPTIPGATVFSNSNNVTFGLNGSTVTATATFPAQTVQPVAVSGSNGSFAYSTLTMGSSNGMHFYTTNGSVVGSYTQPALTQLAAGTNITLTSNGSTISIVGPVFSNSNNVTFGANAGTITASASYPAQTVQPVAASGSNGSFAFSTLSHGNSNGISFYTTNGSIVASYTVPGHTGPTAIAAGTQTATSGTQVFSNSNNVSFTMNGSSQIVASASFNQSVQPVAASGSNGSFQFSTLTFGASNGATFYTTNNSVVVSYTVPTQTVQPVAASASNGSFNFSTLAFVQGSGVTWATQAGGIQASVKTDYLTTAAQSDHSHGNPTLALTNLTGTTASNSAGFTLSLSAAAPGGGGGAAIKGSGTYSQNTGTVEFANSNGVTFGLSNNGTMTASFAQSQITGGTNITLSSNGSTVSVIGPTFSNANNVTFGINGQTITASASFAPVLGLYGVGNTTGNASSDTTDVRSVTFSGAGNVSVGWSNDTFIISGAGGGGGGAAVGISTAGNTQGDSGVYSNGTYIFEGSNGLSVSQLTAATPGVQTLRLVAPTQTAFVFNNANGVTFGTNGSTVTASHNGLTTAANSTHTHGSGPSITGSISVTSNSSAWSISIPAFLTTAMASNAGSNFMSTSQSNNYFYTSNNTFANSTHSHGNPTLALTNITGTTASASNGFTLSLSAANAGNISQTGPNIADGNGNTVTSGTVVFSNSNNVSFGLNGSIMTASAAGGGERTDSQWPLLPPAMYSSSLYTGASGNTGGSTQWTVSGYLGPIVLTNALHFSDFEYYISATNASGTGSMSIGHQFGIYSLNGGTALSLITSFCWQASMTQSSVTAQSWHQYRHTASSTFSTAQSGNVSASYTGIRQLVCHTGSQSLGSGTYALAHIYTARSSGSNVLPAGSGFYVMNAAGSGSTWSTGGARMGTNTTEPMMHQKYLGIFSTTTNMSTLMLPIMPVSINTTAATRTGGSSQWRYPAPVMYL